MKNFLTLSWSLVLVAFWHGTTLPARAHSPVEEMAEAANYFLMALTPEQKAKATFEWKDSERQNWHFIPKDRKGLPFKEMTSAQQRLAQALLASGMSQRGYVKAVTIMSLEQVLKEIEGGKTPFTRDPELYYVSIFGAPEPKGAWGWRVEGHHLSANFTIVKGELLAGTPSFFGTNPAEVKEGPRKGTRVLGDEEDFARQLVKAFSADQRRTAVVTNVAPKDIFTAAERHVKALDSVGLPAAKMTHEQSELLLKLVKEYIQRVRPEMAKNDLTKIQKAGFEKILFAWMGGVEPGEGHYYRVQGPTFLLEYDNTQNNNNHVHAVWRDFENDFGEDLLRKHYQETPHP